MGQIADILQARGKLDDALRIRQQEELPVYESLGDLRSGAVTMGQIANILERLGKLDEAIAMRRESNTACERFGNAHDLLMGRANLAVSLAMRGRQEDKAEVEALLKAAHRAAMGMKIPEARWIEGLIKQHVQKPKANKYSQGLPTKKRRK
jgi:Ca2+-binding EF-hand superfamily protein